MPRKAYVADLSELCSGPAVLNITNVKRGDDDGTFLFTYCAPEWSVDAVEFSGMIPDLSEYPESHQCFIYATGDAPAFMTSAIDKLNVNGHPLRETLIMVSSGIGQVLSTGEEPIIHSDDDAMGGESDGASVGGWSEDGLDADGDSQMMMPGANDDNTTASRQAAMKILRTDLKAAKSAGFRVGVLGDYRGGMEMYVSISIRVSKLGISDEAIGAWKLDKLKYFMVLIHYTQGYQPLDKLTQDTGYHARCGVELFAGAHARYKPTLQQAISVFSKVQKGDRDGLVATSNGLESESQLAEAKEPQLEPIFLSGPLHELLNKRLKQLLSYRMNLGFSWDGAELYYNEHQGRESTKTEDLHDGYYQTQSSTKVLADVVAADGLTQSPAVYSFPLLAMQYALRHLVRCTEFCLICHNRVSMDFEALKPYVCSSPLCLYQYMSLGFGPSIEHEIVSQPTVVDLLISFCYSSARNGALETFPDGMSLMVPDMTSTCTVYTCQYQRHKHEIQCEPDLERPPLRVGDWIAMTMDLLPEYEWHARVLEVEYFPKIVVANPIMIHAFNSQMPAQIQNYTPAIMPSAKADARSTPPTTDPMVSLPGETDTIPVKFRIYNTNFDGLTVEHKRDRIISLLYTLPRVSEMRTWLQWNTKLGEEASLKKWVNRISPTALGCLRWIIASNRSCIMALDDLQAEAEGRETPVHNQRVYGLQGEWLQFRFAMGAPDKEQRFVTSVREVQQRLGSQYPTLFAFHGSPLRNWHGIIREGLHFKQTLHGRAFGNGCYHSLDLSTSLGYSGMASYNSPSYSSACPTSWPHSDLDVQSALSLNEIVNAPNEFVSKTPHLVVAQLDWIQTRYLFVQCRQRSTATGNLIVPPRMIDVVPVKVPVWPRLQDPKFTPRSGTNHLVIPATPGNAPPPPAAAQNEKTPAKKRSKTIKSRIVGKLAQNGRSSKLPIDVDCLDDGASVCTNASDRDFFLSDVEEPAPVRTVSLKRKPSRMDAFVPGSLDYSKITFMDPPAYASNSATRRLQVDLAALIKTQESAPSLEDLGFYLNSDKVDNVYQWIVELHSFPEHLPLVKDMRSRSPPISSIVLELRFGAQYPMSPPFVRVIRPRFLGFQQGGGGNVTLGGALCMELLTNTGWSAVNSVESVLLQVRMAICDEERPARLEHGPVRSYNIHEAKEAYLRACRAHGWEVPNDFQSMV